MKRVGDRAHKNGVLNVGFNRISLPVLSIRMPRRPDEVIHSIGGLPIESSLHCTFQASLASTLGALPNKSPLSIMDEFTRRGLGMYRSPGIQHSM